MKIDLCCFSGFKIYPGPGRTLVEGDGRSYKFLSSRTLKTHLLEMTPRNITWTVLYRRKHKKSLEEDVTKNTALMCRLCLPDSDSHALSSNPLTPQPCRSSCGSG